MVILVTVVSSGSGSSEEVRDAERGGQGALWVKGERYITEVIPNQCVKEVELQILVFLFFQKV